MYIYVRLLLDLSPCVVQSDFVFKFFYDFVYFNWRGMVARSVFFYKILL
jgi:hypothetical protein